MRRHQKWLRRRNACSRVTSLLQGLGNNRLWDSDGEGFGDLCSSPRGASGCRKGLVTGPGVFTSHCSFASSPLYRRETTPHIQNICLPPALQSIRIRPSSELGEKRQRLIKIANTWAHRPFSILKQKQHTPKPITN